MKGVKEAPEIEAAAGSEQVGIVGPNGHIAKREVNKNGRKRNSLFCTERFHVEDQVI